MSGIIRTFVPGQDGLQVAALQLSLVEISPVDDTLTTQSYPTLSKLLNTLLEYLARLPNENFVVVAKLGRC